MSNHAPEQVEAVAKDARFAGFETYADMLYGYAALLRENLCAEAALAATGRGPLSDDEVAVDKTTVIGVDHGSADGDCTVRGRRKPDGTIVIDSVEYAAPATNPPKTASKLVAPATDLDTIALAAANHIALMWGQDRSQFVSKIQVRVLGAMREAWPAAVQRQLDTLVEEVREAADLRERMGTILTEVADVLKGPRPSGGLHSWHDLYAVAAHVVAERNAAQSRIATAPVAIIDTRDVLSLCAPAEEDFPALYAMQGQRVALVKLPPERDTHA